jgi:hypothetical protein
LIFNKLKQSSSQFELATILLKSKFFVLVYNQLSPITCKGSCGAPLLFIIVAGPRPVSQDGCRIMELLRVPWPISPRW